MEDTQAEEDTEGQCLGCSFKALPRKVLCQACLLEAAKDKEAEKADMIALIKHRVRDSLQEVLSKTTQPGTVSSPPFAQRNAPREPSLASGTEDDFAGLTLR